MASAWGTADRKKLFERIFFAACFVIGALVIAFGGASNSPSSSTSLTDSSSDSDRVTTTFDRQAFAYCESAGPAGLAAELGMPADDFSDLAYEYALKIQRVTSTEDGVDAMTSCHEGLISSTGLADSLGN